MLALRALLLLCVAQLARGQPAAPPAPPAPPAPSTPPVFRLDRRQLRHLQEDLHKPPTSVRGGLQDVIEELYLENQILDHFNPTDKRTWKQRYFRRTELYKEGGPVFIYIGGEGQEGARRLASGKLFMTYLAERFRAKMYDLEHRYYGFSHPTPDLSSTSLQYLSADQALADLAYFIEYLKEAGELLPGQKVAVFGGSYPGNLAAWARLKYPHLVHAAVSSSAPVHAEADYPEYMQVVKNSLDRVAGKWCAANVKLASDRIVELLKTADGVAQVKKIFHIATDLTAKEDIDIFFEILSNPFAGAVQYNRDSAPQSAYNIKYICSFVAGDNLTPDEAMQKLSNLVYGGQTNVPPQDWSYKSQIASYGLTSYQLQDGEYDASRQWLYQTCTEFGYFQTFSGDGTPFPKEYNDLAYAIKLCKDVYGDAYDEAVVNGAIKRSNLVFGDRSPDVNKVIFVNGNIDPWHALGILSDVSDAAPAVMVDGGSHCADMNYPSAMWDTPSVSAAHKKVHQFLLGALYEAPDGRPAY